MGKGSEETVPDYTTQDSSATNEAMTAYMTQMTQMMGSLSAQMSQMQTPEMPATPDVYSTTAIDWTEKQQQLASKMKADYNVDEARRKGRQDTILTSPLLDEEEAETTTSVLAGN